MSEAEAGRNKFSKHKNQRTYSVCHKPTFQFVFAFFESWFIHATSFLFHAPFLIHTAHTTFENKLAHLRIAVPRETHGTSRLQPSLLGVVAPTHFPPTAANPSHRLAASDGPFYTIDRAEPGRIPRRPQGDAPEFGQRLAGAMMAAVSEIRRALQPKSEETYTSKDRSLGMNRHGLRVTKSSKEISSRHLRNRILHTYFPFVKASKERLYKAPGRTSFSFMCALRTKRTSA